MVSVRMSELSLGLVSLLPLTVGSEVRVGDCRQSQSAGGQERGDSRRTREHGGDAEDLVRALELGRDDEHLGELRLEGERRHDVSEGSEVCNNCQIWYLHSEMGWTHCPRRQTQQGS